MADDDFSDVFPSDEATSAISDENIGTETIDLSSLLTKDLTFSGSFDVRGNIWASTFGKLTQALPLPTILIDRNLRIVVANQACARISPDYEKILDQPFGAIFHDPAAARRLQGLVDDIFLDRKPRVGEGIIGIAQRSLWGRITLRAIRIMGNRFVLGLVEDLTSQKREILLKQKLNEELKREIGQREQVERRLAESEKKYREVIETAGDIIYQTDRNGCFTMVNPVALRTTGYSGEELIGKSYLELIRPDYRQSVEKFYGIQSAKGLPMTYQEFPIITESGETIWVGQNVQILAEDEVVVGFQAIARNITDRKKAEESLRQSEVRYKDLFDHATDGIYTHDLKGNYTSVNEAASRIVGYSRDELLSMNFKDLVDPEYLSVMEENLRTKVQNGVTSTGPYEVLVRSKRGDPLWLEVTSRIITEEGIPIAVHGTARDVTERKLLEDRLLQAAKMEALGTLAGGLAHDFNNLLQIILGYADLIATNKGKQEKDFKSARTIRDAAMRGRNLVNRILTFSRRIEATLRPIDLNSQLNQIGQLLHGTIPKMIEIEMCLTDVLSPINADETQIEQILLNLAVNAAHAMPEGGRLTFETKNVSLDEEYCRTHMETKPGDYVMLSVSDTGHGMDKEIIDRIFEPFFTTKKPGEGTGLGLSMVFGIVKNHNGHIFCRSKPGAGTVFKIYFPAIQAQIVGDPSSTLQMPSFGSETILLVDDEESIRDLVKEILTKAGYKVFVVRNGREAVEIYGQFRHQISLVILDLMMPEMGGKRCLSELIKINPELKVVVASGHLLDGSEAEAWASGVKAFLSKPYNMKQLLGIVRHTLDAE